MGKSSLQALPSEDQAEFDRLLESCRDEFTPRGVHETFLVEQMAWSLWRARRFERLATIARDDGNRKAAAAMLRLAKSAQRSYDWALRTLSLSRRPASPRKARRGAVRLVPLPAEDTAYRV